MTCYSAQEPLRGRLFIETGQLQRGWRKTLFFCNSIFAERQSARISFPVSCILLLMLLYAAAALQVHVNCSTPMFQHPAKPSKSFLHTKIYSSNKYIVFLLLFLRGSHILTVCQQSVSSSGPQGTYLVTRVCSSLHCHVTALITDDVRLTCHWATD